jgi:hypothetical protein
LELLRGELDEEGIKMLSKKKEKFSLRHCTGVLKRLARWGGCKKPLSRKKEKFSLRHCTGVLV